MFELSVASKYLLPRRRQLSVSIISLVSTLVISLVVWLIVVFFSVTDGLERNWVQKLTALTAPVRITPTDAYYHSYYYQIDAISDSAGYYHKNIKEKRESQVTDPYDPDQDEEIPAYWSLPDRNPDGSLKDLVKLAYASLAEIDTVPGLKPQDFELTVTTIHLRLLRDAYTPYFSQAFGHSTLSVLSYPAYLGNFEQDNRQLNQTLTPIRSSDLNNVFNLLGVADDPTKDDQSGEKTFFSPAVLQSRLTLFFDSVAIEELKTRSSGWTIPRSLLPDSAQWQVYAILKDDKVVRTIIPLNDRQFEAAQALLNELGLSYSKGQLTIAQGLLELTLDNQSPQLLPAYVPLTIEGGASLQATLVDSSIAKAKRLEDLRFKVQFSIQGVDLQGIVSYRGLEIGQTRLHGTPSFWVHDQTTSDGSLSFVLPKDPEVGQGVLLPKSFKEGGVLVGDRGYLTYLTPTTSVLLEQHLPMYVAGFYDPGIIPIGGKFILANPEVASLIRSAHNGEEKAQTNGINVQFTHIQDADAVKSKLLESFKQKGISRYWTVETYRDYEFTKEIMHELQSQKTYSPSSRSSLSLSPAQTLFPC